MSTNEDLTTRLGQIRKESGNGQSATYNYAIGTNEFANLWYKLHHDLGYPLKIDSRYKRAIVYNKQGLEQKIEKMITEVMKKNFDIFADIITKDIENRLNNAIQTANGNIVLGKSGNNTSMISLLTSSATKGLVKGFFNILDDITSYDDRRK